MVVVSPEKTEKSMKSMNLRQLAYENMFSSFTPCLQGSRQMFLMIGIDYEHRGVTQFY